MGAPQLHSVAVPAQQIAALSEHEGMLTVKNKTGEVAGLAVTDGIVRPAVAAVPAHQQGAVASCSPDCSIAIPSQIHVAVAIGDRDDRLAPALEVPGLIIEADLCASGDHPKVAVRLVTDALQALAAHALVHLPDRIARSPGGIEVAEAADAYVAAVITATQVADGTSCASVTLASQLPPSLWVS